jgi:hypothetical protein
LRRACKISGLFVSFFSEAGRLAHWREKFWSRRYQAIPVSEEEAAQVERLRYILAHGCKEAFVERLRDWPGVSAVGALLEEEPLQGYWFDRTREHAGRRRGLAFERLSYAWKWFDAKAKAQMPTR